MIIYKTTNLVNGKFYIGQDSKNNPEYLGSGLLLNKAIEKYGRENFLKEVVEQCNSKEELNSREIFWISELKPLYNIAKGGIGGDTRYKFTQDQYDQWIFKKKQNVKGGMPIGYKWDHPSPLKGKKRKGGTPWLCGDLNPAKRLEVREKISKSKLGKFRPTEQCIHCGLIAQKTNIIRWHNEKCKFKTKE
jgi:group I intron endonuclease